VDKNGSISVEKNTTFSDITKPKSDDYSDLPAFNEPGNDYSDDEDDKPHIASVFLKGYTYTYALTKRRDGDGANGRCCRPSKLKCKKDKKRKGEEICKRKEGKAKCGKGCSRIIRALESLERRERAKKQQKKKAKAKQEQRKAKSKQRKAKEAPSAEENSTTNKHLIHPRPFEEYKVGDSFEEYSHVSYSEEDSEEYYEEDYEKASKGDSKEETGSKRSKELAKLTPNQLRELEKVSNKASISQNPKCIMAAKEALLFR
jgi:hypothetical protein